MRKRKIICALLVIFMLVGGIVDILPGVNSVREFDTLKCKKVPQSLEIGLFFCQIFIFII